MTMYLTIDLLRRQSRRGEVELDDAIPSFLPGPVSTMNVLRFGIRSNYIRQPTENLSASIFTTIEEAKGYILTGDATLTIESRRSGTKFTYRVTRCKDKEQPDLYFVSLLI
jgi:hypothetical protein